MVQTCCRCKLKDCWLCFCLFALFVHLLFLYSKPFSIFIVCCRSHVQCFTSRNAEYLARHPPPAMTNKETMKSLALTDSFSRMVFKHKVKVTSVWLEASGMWRVNVPSLGSHNLLARGSHSCVVVPPWFGECSYLLSAYAARNWIDDSLKRFVFHETPTPPH